MSALLHEATAPVLVARAAAIREERAPAPLEPAGLELERDIVRYLAFWDIARDTEGGQHAA